MTTPTPEAHPTDLGVPPDARTGAQPGNAPPSTLSVVDAARVASVNGRTIRRVIADGKLVATLEDGAYRVSPADLAAWTSTRAPRTTSSWPPDVAEDTVTGVRSDAHPGARGDGHPGVQVADVLAAKDETIARLDGEVAFLRDQLDQARRDLVESQRSTLVARELDAQRIETRLEALTAQIVDQREDAPTVAPEAVGRDDVAHEGQPASWWTRTWRKVWGS